MGLEIDARGHLDAVGAVSEVDRVQVAGQDPVLRPLPLELPGESRLLQLAADRLVGLDIGVPDELLRDRRGSLHELPARDVRPDSPQNAAEIDSPVLEESSILDGDDRLLHDRSDLGRADDDPALVASQDGQHRLPVSRVDGAVLLVVPLRRRVERREVGRDRRHEPERERDRAEEAENHEEQQEAKLADPAPRLPRRLRGASSEQHEAGLYPGTGLVEPVPGGRPGSVLRRSARPGPAFRSAPVRRLPARP